MLVCARVEEEGRKEQKYLGLAACYAAKLAVYPSVLPLGTCDNLSFSFAEKERTWRETAGDDG